MTVPIAGSNRVALGVIAELHGACHTDWPGRDGSPARAIRGRMGTESVPLGLARVERRDRVRGERDMRRVEEWQHVHQDLYAVLGVPRDASEARIDSAWRSRVKQAHPDLGGDADEFRDVVVAYRVLSDPSQRRRYDMATRSPAPDPAWEERFGFDWAAARRPEAKSEPWSREEEWPVAEGTETPSRWRLALGVLLCVAAVIISYLVPVFTVIGGTAVLVIVSIRYWRHARKYRSLFS